MATIIDLTKAVGDLVGATNVKLSTLDGKVATATSAVTAVNQALQQSPSAAALQVNLAGPNGAGMLGFRGRFVSDALLDRATIQFFGGAGDFDPTNPQAQWTNNYDALVAAINEGMTGGDPSRIIVYLPYRKGMTNKYRFEGGIIPYGYIVLAPAPGVELWGDNIRFECEVLGGAKVRPIGPYCRYGNPLTGRGARKIREREKQRFLGAADSYEIKTEPIAAAEWRKSSAPWPGNLAMGGDDTWANGDAGFTVDATTVTFNALAGDGRIHAVLTRVAPCEQIAARFSIAAGQGGFDIWVGARTTKGWQGFFVNPGTNAGNRVGKVAGQDYNQANANASVVGSLDHQSIFFGLATVVLRRLSLQRFQVLVGGVVYLDHTFADPITEMGYGCYCRDASTWQLTDYVRQRGMPLAAARSIGVHIAGDSISAERPDSWSKFFYEALEGTAGIRVVQLTNQAVAGDDANGMLTILNQRAGQAGYTANGFPLGTTDFVCAIGTNNIQAVQQSSSVATYETILATLVQKALDDGIRVVLVTPPQFYSRALGGGVGQDTKNYGGGAPYRAAVRRVSYAKKVALVESEPAYGQITGHFVNPSLMPYWGPSEDGTVSGCDPMVTDGIHNGGYMSMLMGPEIAMAMVGQLNGVVGLREKGNWIVLPAAYYLNQWTPDQNDPVRYRLLPDFEIEWGGLAVKGGTVADGTAVLSIPPGLMPKVPKRRPAFSESMQIPRILAQETGSVLVYGFDGANGVTLNFDALRYSLD